METGLPKRIMLLLTARTYRGQAFKEAAGRLGVEICAAVDMQQELANYWNYPLGVNFNDLESTIETIKRYAEDKPLGAVLPVDDSGGAVAAEVSQQLGLRHNSAKATLAARDKYVMRKKLKEVGVKIPHFSLNHFPYASGLEYSDIERQAEEMEYPLVIKPLNLSGSRGVMRVNSANEFRTATNRLHQILLNHDSHADRIPFLIESYIDGIEVAVEGLLDDGQLHLLAIFDKPDPLIGPFFEETIYVTPSQLSDEIQERIAICCSKAAAAVGLSQGPIHAELRINEEGVWLIEIAGRSIGGLCSKTLQFDLGTSLEELIIRQALGMDISEFTRQRDASGVMMIPIPKAGILRSVSGIQKALSIPLIENVEITARLNYSLVPLPEGDSYLGFIFARGESSQDVVNALRQAHHEIEFEILPELTINPENKYFNFQT